MIFQGAVGQAAKVILAAQYLDNTGAPATPTSPQIKVYGGSPLALRATLTPAEVSGVTGFLVAELDVSNVTSFPGGQYVVRWTGVTSGAPTSIVDTLQLDPSSAFAAAGALSNSYTTEARIRAVSKLLLSVSTVPPDSIALAAVNGAIYINGRLSQYYAIPFGAPYPDILVLLNDWKAAALAIDRYHSENGNRSQFAGDLHAWVDAYLDKLILEGIPGVVPIAVSSGSLSTSSDSKHLSYIMQTAVPSLSARNRD